MNLSFPSYFQLNPELSLRGWRDVKRALRRPDGAVCVLPQAALDAIELAWAGIPANSPAMLPTQREWLSALVNGNMGKFVEHPAAPRPEQRFRQAPCDYVASIHWSITGHCNLRCKHCYVEAPDSIYGELSLADCADIMDQMVEANIQSVSLTGGEPLIRADWWEFYRELGARLIAVTALYTNGLLVTEKWLDRFSQLEPEKILFSLSFDGIGHHDWLRGREGMEQRTIDAIRLLVERGYPVEIETALYRDNLPSIPDTCELLHQLGVKVWKLSGMSDSGGWLRYADEHSITTADLNRCYLETLDRFESLGRPFTLQMDYRYVYMRRNDKAIAPAVHGDGSARSLRRPVCSCARLHPYLLPDATLMPCMPLSNCGLDAGMPNMKTSRLVNVFRPGTEFFDFISMTPEEVFARQDGDCPSCEHRLECCGGCRARAYGTGELFGPDPDMCDYFKNGTRRLFEKHYTPAHGCPI